MPDNGVEQPIHSILFLHALTGFHPGSGTALGVVDLPVMRERHTQWPTIPGSSVKGVLRDTCRRNGGQSDLWSAAFGPEKIEGQGDAFAGALVFTDARLLAFPVRSLRGVFAWVTCPAVLERLGRDLGYSGLPAPDPIEGPHANEILCPETSPLLIDGEAVLEEFNFTRAGDGAHVADWVAGNAVRDPVTAERLRTHLAVLHDDDFTHFVRHATEVTARVGLDPQTKTVRGGALFYQEFLPPETLFYTLVIAERSRCKDRPADAEEFMAYLRSNLLRVIQIGGDETIGKGLCATQLVDGIDKR